MFVRKREEQIGFGGDDHDADAEHGEHDVDNLARLGLGHEDVVDERREDKGDEGDGQAADETHHHLEEGADHGDHRHQHRHEDAKRHAVGVLHEHGVLRLRCDLASLASLTLLDAALEGEDAGEHGDGVGEVGDEADADAADDVHDGLGIDVGDDERLDAFCR